MSAISSSIKTDLSSLVQRQLFPKAAQPVKPQIGDSYNIHTDLTSEANQGQELPKSKWFYLRKNLNFFNPFTYHQNIGKLITQANLKAKSTDNPIHHFNTVQDIQRIFSNNSEHPQHVIGVFRSKMNHSQAISIYKEPGKDGRISCLAFDSCNTEPFTHHLSPFQTDMVDWGAIFNASKQWNQIAHQYSDSNPRILTIGLGSQQDFFSCGLMAFAAARKMASASSTDVLKELHRRHLEDELNHYAYQAPQSVHQKNHNYVDLTDDLQCIADVDKSFLAKLLIHDQDRQHLESMVQQYGLEDIDLRSPEKQNGTAPKTLLSRFNRIKPAGSSGIQMLDKWRQQAAKS